MTFKVLISDKMSPKAVEIFKERGVEVDVKTSLSPEELKSCIGEYDGLAIRSATKATAEIIEAGKKLKVIGRAGIGVDNIDRDAATAKGMIVMNTPFGNAVTTAEHAIALMLSLSRRIPEASVSTHAGKWEKSKFMGVEVTGKKLGLIGCGNIGSIVANRALGLKMKVLAFDPFLSEERAENIGVQKVELEQLLAEADFITLHTPLNEHTRNIISAESFEKMKDGVRIVNCARGGLIDEVALKAALESGKVAGVALDVYEVEPAREHALFGMENVVVTPHLGASTVEAQENVAVQVAEQLSDYLLNGAVVNAINAPSIAAEDASKLEPYLKLMTFMGGIIGQRTNEAILSVEISYEGEVVDLETRPLTSTFLVALLSPNLENVNQVNASLIAKNRGIEIVGKKKDHSNDYQTLIRVKIKTQRKNYIVAGTILQNDPRVIEIDGVDLEASMSENILYVRNQDQPGLIGSLGQLLSDAGINIATFHLGRVNAGGDALSLIGTDQFVPEDVLNEINRLPQVLRAKALKF